MNVDQTGRRRALPLLCLLTTLSASGLAGAHGAPDGEGAPSHLVQARITAQPDIPGWRAMILDAPRPAIMVSYRGSDPVTILGSEGEAFLRFTGEAVLVNPQSPSWKALPNAPSLARMESGDAGPGIAWARLSESPSYGWLDARLAPEQPHHGNSEPEGWAIKVQTESGETAEISGVFTQKSLPRAH